MLRRTPNIQRVDLPIKSPDSEKPIRIDIVADNGRTWIKVIARNPKALKDIALGCSNYGSKSILDHAVQYIERANSNQCFFQTPRVCFLRIFLGISLNNIFNRFLLNRLYLILLIKLIENWRKS